MATGCVCSKTLANGSQCKGVGDKAAFLVNIKDAGRGCSVVWLCPGCGLKNTIKKSSDRWLPIVVLKNALPDTKVKAILTMDGPVVESESDDEKE